jgi:hypothetical protein
VKRRELKEGSQPKLDETPLGRTLHAEIRCRPRRDAEKSIYSMEASSLLPHLGIVEHTLCLQCTLHFSFGYIRRLHRYLHNEAPVEDYKSRHSPSFAVCTILASVIKMFCGVSGDWLDVTWSSKRQPSSPIMALVSSRIKRVITWLSNRVLRRWLLHTYMPN